jgi:hypothetical protein
VKAIVRMSNPSPVDEEAKLGKVLGARLQRV